jgi:hypothetical protein
MSIGRSVVSDMFITDRRPRGAGSIVDAGVNPSREQSAPEETGTGPQ